MSDKIAIRVENVSKDFKLPHETHSSLKSRAVNLFRSKKGYERQHALKDISLEIKKGEFFGIVGRNGSGKSTLLKMLAGIYQPTRGKISVSGKLVPFIELGVGFNPELTGRENVFLNGALLGFTNQEIAKQYDDIVAFAELSKFMDQKLKNYSSGMQVRLAFAMAVRANADILLIDEVLAVGDADFQRKCFTYFKSLKKNRKTVVFVSHDMGAVREFCDRAALIDASKLVAVGSSETIAKKYTQLFAESMDQEQAQPQLGRWGNKKAQYKNVQTKFDNKNNELLITAEVTAAEHVPDPTYGIMIATAAGQSILGTNTHIEIEKVAPLSPRQTVTVGWKIPHIFNSGEYSIELTLMYNSITEVADWWEDAGSFTVVNEKKTPYLVNPPTEFISD